MLLGERVLVHVRVALDDAVLQLGVVDLGGFVGEVQSERVVGVERLAALLAVDQDLRGAIYVARGYCQTMFDLEGFGV